MGDSERLRFCYNNLCRSELEWVEGTDVKLQHLQAKPQLGSKVSSAFPGERSKADVPRKVGGAYEMGLETLPAECCRLLEGKAGRSDVGLLGLWDLLLCSTGVHDERGKWLAPRAQLAAYHSFFWEVPRGWNSSPNAFLCSSLPSPSWDQRFKSIPG